MAHQILSEEFRRMQKLAGLLKEEDSNQSVVLYASWLSNNEENKEFFPRAVLYPGDNNLTKVNAPGTVDGIRKKGIECMGEVFQVVSTPENEEKEADEFKMTVVKFQKPISEIFIDYGDFDLDTFSIIKDIDKAYDIVDNNINLNKQTSLFSLVNPPDIVNKIPDIRISDEWLNAQIDKYYPKDKDDPEARKNRFDDLKSTYEFYIKMEKKQREKKKGSSGSGGMYYGCYVKDIKPNEIMSVKEFYQEKAPKSF
jgi:hypothetical protein